MLASLSGVCQLLLGVLHLESYSYYLLPFPLVLSAVRSGPAACRKTLLSTFFLTIVLLGPPRAISYILLYGIVGVTLGTLWHLRCPWWLTWPSCTAAYVGAMMSYIYVASFLLKENLFKLVIYNVHTTVIKVAALCNAQGKAIAANCRGIKDCVVVVNPSPTAVVVVLVSFLALRGLFYTYILQFCYVLLLTGMGYTTGPMPQFVERLLQKRYGNDSNNS